MRKSVFLGSMYLGVFGAQDLLCKGVRGATTTRVDHMLATR